MPEKRATLLAHNEKTCGPACVDVPAQAASRSAVVRSPAAAGFRPNLGHPEKRNDICSGTLIEEHSVCSAKRPSVGVLITQPPRGHVSRMPKSTTIGRCLFSRCNRNLPHAVRFEARSSDNSGQSGRTFGRLRVHSGSTPCQTWPSSVEIGPSWASIGPSLPKLDPDSVDSFDRCCSKLGPESSDANCGPDRAHLAPPKVGTSSTRAWRIRRIWALV